MCAVLWAIPGGFSGANADASTSAIQPVDTVSGASTDLNRGLVGVVVTGSLIASALCGVIIIAATLYEILTTTPEDSNE